MLIGLVVFLGSTFFLCFSVNLAMLLVGRILQGISGSLTWTVGMALVCDTVDSRHVGQAMGYVGMATSIALVIAPLLGGVVYRRGGYYAVFIMCFGIIVVDIVMRLLIIEVKDAKKWLDVEPQSNQPNDAALNQAPTEKGNEDGGQTEAQGRPDQTPTTQPTDSVPTSGSSTASMLRLFRNVRLWAALWGTLALAVFQTSFDSTLPLLVAAIFHWDSVGAGLIYLPLMLPCFLSPVVGMLGDKFGPKWMSMSGFLACTPLAICLRFVTEDTMGNKVLLCALLAGIGFAAVFVFGPLMAEITWAIQDDVDAEETSPVPYAMAYGLYNMAWSAGAMLGPIMGGMIRESAGWGTVGWSLAILSFVSAITTVLWVGKPLNISWKGRRRATQGDEVDV